MKVTIKDKFDAFLKSPKEYPLLAGFSIGFYALVFYYSNNLDSVNSWVQTVYSLFYFILCPAIVAFAICKIVQKSKYRDFVSSAVFATILLYFLILVFRNSIFFSSVKRIAVSTIVFGAILLVSFIKFKIKNYKYFVVFVWLMTVLPTIKLGKMVYFNLTNSADWQLQPDHILSTKFKKSPNVYFIQPDGYAGDDNLKGSLYQFDNSKFDNWLASKGFALYNDYRSNYKTTLLSNSSCFYMKHHYSKQDSNFNNPRDYILGLNPVLSVFKNNEYKTFFLTENPYFLINRAKVGFDFCNFNFQELSYFDDGWQKYKKVDDELKYQVKINKTGNNFFFIEKFRPCHITVDETAGATAKSERQVYVEHLQEANQWLTEIVSFIERNDPTAIIIIGADHGGFVGFEYTMQSYDKITNPDLLNSMFGAKLAIRWGNSSYQKYDSKLKTSVNLFRVLFSYLSEDKTLLNNLQPDFSYNNYDRDDYTKTNKVIDENGSSEFLRRPSKY